MKRTTVLLFIIFSTCLNLNAQKSELPVFLKSSVILKTPILSKSGVDSFNRQTHRFHNKVFALLQFQSIPSAESRKLLSAKGVELLDYIPENTFTVSISGNPEFEFLRSVGVKSLLQPTAKQKMEPRLGNGIIPDWSVRMPGTIDVSVGFLKTCSVADVKNFLEQKNITIVSDEWSHHYLLTLRLKTDRLTDLA